MVTGIVDWLHWDPKLAVVTKEIPPLPPHQRTMLMLLTAPRMSLKEIASQLGIKYSTAKEYAQELYKHFNVDDRNGLLDRFLLGGSSPQA
jgi:DNA-binding NarL/FixJ family response regulator